MGNQHRKGISQERAKTIIDNVYPTLLAESPEEYEELWEDLVMASAAHTLSQALAFITGRDPQLVIEIHKEFPWDPTPDEAILLSVFGPNLIYACMATYRSPYVNVSKEGISIDEGFKRHIDTITKSLVNSSRGEQEASRREA